MHENVRLFDEAIKRAGARTVLYLTWAKRHAPETQDAITEAYTSIAKEIGADVIPAGVAWERFMKKHDRPVLHDRDGSHPTIAGTYLAACAAYATLFGAGPRGNTAMIEGLTTGEMKLLQQMVPAAGGRGNVNAKMPRRTCAEQRGVSRDRGF
jgi:hypothetical protein